METNIGVTAIDAGTKAEAIEIGIARIVGDGKPQLCYHKLFRPIRLIDAEAQAKHGINKAMLKPCKQFSAKDADRINRLLRNSGGCFAHNAAFDRAVLEHQFDLVGRAFLPWQKLQCTQEMAREKGLPQSLECLQRRLCGAGRRRKHRANWDALDLALVYKKLRMSAMQQDYFDLNPSGDVKDIIN